MIWNVKAIFLDSQISTDCLGLHLQSLEKRPNTTLHQPLSHWCTTANYSDKSLIVQLLQTTRMHLMQSVRGGERDWCITLSPMFVILSYKLFSRGVPSGGHYRVNWTYLLLSGHRYSMCVQDNGMAAWVNFLYQSLLYYRQRQWTTFCQMLQLWAMCNSQSNDSKDWDSFEEMEARLEKTEGEGAVMKIWERARWQEDYAWVKMKRQKGREEISQSKTKK